MQAGWARRVECNLLRLPGWIWAGISAHLLEHVYGLYGQLEGTYIVIP